MLTDEQVKQEITSSQRGSDIHGLVEKIAYTLYRGSNSGDADTNWFAAQEILLKWSDHPNRRELRDNAGFGKQVHEILEHYAYDYHQLKLSYHSLSDPYQNWMNGQNKLARQVLDQVN